ncbi:hypothetical protein CVT26_012731 [Gymnopilus dilepis]|uniref:Uncharacterized protein n=1 Tax=Gymnopilus dilepis TaxID=231916 RepID=A0A409WDN0_9AGAR|nr:hypothetical protein CVT26_012731 [Gymnopilus dilepis]
MALPTSAEPCVPSAIEASLSTATSSSYSMPSNQSPANSSTSLHFTEVDSDDEIVWGVSEGGRSTASSDAGDVSASEDDFVVLARPRSAAARHGTVDSGISTPSESAEEAGGDFEKPLSSAGLETAMKGLTLATPEPSPKKANPKSKKEKAVQQPEAVSSAGEDKKRKRKAKKKKKAARAAADAYPSPAPSPKALKTAQALVPASGTHNWFEEMSLGKFVGLGSRPIVDDYSDRQSVISFDSESVSSPTLYEEASLFISRFLSNPDAKSDSICRLTLLQSLIIELGLATPALPESLSAAKTFLKSRAFLNIKEYLAVRDQGPDAVRNLLHPSRSALIKDIKKKRNAASLKWVKQHGLQVLLVGWMR